MHIRNYTPADCQEITQLFYNTVHTVNKKDYTEEQLTAWAPEPPSPAAWNPTLTAHHTLVSLEAAKITGFGDITLCPDGTAYLDRLYIHKDFQRKGIATAICDRLEAFAASQGAAVVTTHASITARPFFEKRGYRVIKEQQVERRGVSLTNFVMEKVIEKERKPI